MIKYKQVFKKVVDDVICDVCGQSTTRDENIGADFATLEASWGYGSPNDGTKYDIHLCENCFNEAIDFLKKKRKQILGPFKYPHDQDPLEGKSYFPS